MMPCFCPKDAIFVLNKWDMIRKEEDKKEFLDIIKEKLHELWKEIEDNNIKTLAAVSFYFSARKHNVFDKTAFPLTDEVNVAREVLKNIIKKNSIIMLIVFLSKSDKFQFFNL